MPSERLQQIKGNPDRIPVHVAIIMDGNGRWASERGLPRREGHRAGMKSVRDVVEGAIEAGIGVITLYAFSQENWRRPKREIAFLMSLLQRYTRSEVKDLVENGVEVHVIGEMERMDSLERKALQAIIDRTRGGTKLQLVLAISYGSRSEITRAVSSLAGRAASGDLAPADIDEGRRGDGLATAEREEFVQLRRDLRVAKLENEILKRAAAYFAAENVLPK